MGKLDDKLNNMQKNIEKNWNNLKPVKKRREKEVEEFAIASKNSLWNRTKCLEYLLEMRVFNSNKKIIGFREIVFDRVSAVELIDESGSREYLHHDERDYFPYSYYSEYSVLDMLYALSWIMPCFRGVRIGLKTEISDWTGKEYETLDWWIGYRTLELFYNKSNYYNLKEIINNTYIEGLEYENTKYDDPFTYMNKFEPSANLYITNSDIEKMPYSIIEYIASIYEIWKKDGLNKDWRANSSSKRSDKEYVYGKWMKIMEPVGSKCSELVVEHNRALTEEQIRKNELLEQEKRRKEEEQKKLAGIEGENKVIYALKWIDKNFRVINEGRTFKLLNFNYMDEPQEYDHIVVGEKGVFVIETKNYSGTIEIDNEGNWIREKDGKKYGEVNPISQIRRHEKLLKSILPDNIPIISFICIPNEKSIIKNSKNSLIPVVKVDMLVEKIETYESDVKLSTTDIENCIHLINTHMTEY